jgi:hypothetical protein
VIHVYCRYHEILSSTPDILYTRSVKVFREELETRLLEDTAFAEFRGLLIVYPVISIVNNSQDDRSQDDSSQDDSSDQDDGSKKRNLPTRDSSWLRPLLMAKCYTLRQACREAKLSDEGKQSQLLARLIVDKYQCTPAVAIEEELANCLGSPRLMEAWAKARFADWSFKRNAHEVIRKAPVVLEVIRKLEEEYAAKGTFL